MAMGNTIVLAIEPKGVWKEGTIDGTPKPGTCMQIKASAGRDASGRYTWEAYDRAFDALPGLICVLIEDREQGKTTADAYVSGTRGRMYCPAAGEELNVIIENISGTADDYAIADLLEINDGSGKLQDANTGTTHNYSLPFQLLETITDPTADYLAHVQYTGH